MATENKNLGTIMESMFKGMDYYFGTKSVVGDPIKLDDKTFVVPLVDVSFGVGAGAGLSDKNNRNIGGGGMGATMKPSAVLVVQDGVARIINIQEQDKMVHFIEGLPDTVRKVLSFLKRNDQVDEAVEEAFDDMEI